MSGWLVDESDGALVLVLVAVLDRRDRRDHDAAVVGDLLNIALRWCIEHDINIVTRFGIGARNLETHNDSSKIEGARGGWLNCHSITARGYGCAGRCLYNEPRGAPAIYPWGFRNA